MRKLIIYIFAFFVWSCQTDTQTKTENPIDKWNDLKVSDKPLVYSPEAFMDDIALPNMSDIKGQAKFISRENKFYIGYKIKFNIDHLDTTIIPRKYRETKKIDNSDFTVLPTEEVTYLVVFKLMLLDKDGFEIQNISSKAEYVQSGKVNEFQNIIELPISNENVQLTKEINLEILVDKCVTCTKDK